MSAIASFSRSLTGGEVALLREEVRQTTTAILATTNGLVNPKTRKFWISALMSHVAGINDTLRGVVTRLDNPTEIGQGPAMIARGEELIGLVAAAGNRQELFAANGEIVPWLMNIKAGISTLAIVR